MLAGANVKEQDLLALVFEKTTHIKLNLEIHNLTTMMDARPIWRLLQ
jgi:hypothetical protein